MIKRSPPPPPPELQARPASPSGVGLEHPPGPLAFSSMINNVAFHAVFPQRDFRINPTCRLKK